MRRTRTLAGIGIAATALLALTACNSGTPSSTGAPEGGEETSSSTPWTVLTDVTIDGSPTFDRIESSGKIKVGVKEDQPGLGYLDPVTGDRTGFDVDIARWMAASLGVDPEKIEFQAIASANREQAIVNGDIDYYVGTYSITDKRKEQISFAGPYFVTGQGLLVGADSGIKSVDDLSAETTVCSATGSTPIQNIKTNYPEVPTKEYDTY
ncbi:MAG: transporter substrate-binding domain-containing protein, partial [Microbacterium sp.]